MQFTFHQFAEPIWLVIGLLLVPRSLSPRVYFSSLAVVSIRIFTAYYYFNHYQGESFLRLDDVHYFNVGVQLSRDLGWKVVYLPFTDDWSRLLDAASSYNFVYYWVCSVIVTITGYEYQNLVYANIIFSLLAARFFYTYLIKKDVEEASPALYLVLLLTPAVCAWTTVMAIKDVFILFLLSSTLYVRELVRGSGYFIPILLLLLLACFYTRFYLALIMVAAFGAETIISEFSVRRLILLSLAVGVGSAMLLFLPAVNFSNAAALLKFGPEVSVGAIRYLLTPMPWSVSDEYGFLKVPSLFSVSMLPIALIGFFSVKKSRIIPIIFVFLAMCTIYGAFPGQQGPRYRLQIEYILTFFFFAGCCFLIGKEKSKNDI